MRTKPLTILLIRPWIVRFDPVAGYMENPITARSEKQSGASSNAAPLVSINPRHRALTLIRVAGMNRNIFYIIGVIVVIVIVLKLLGVF
jgi:hypothetical protein